jgi:hypothetical protein
VARIDHEAKRWASRRRSGLNLAAGPSTPAEAERQSAGPDQHAGRAQQRRCGLERAQARGARGFVVGSPACGASFSGIDVGSYFREQDVSAILHMRKAMARVAKELAPIATSLEADLVVTGCYDPSRTREHIFGGASRDFSIFGVAPGYGPSKRSVEKHVASGSRGIIGFPSTPPTTSMGCSRNAATHFALSPIVPSLRPQNSA